MYKLNSTKQNFNLLFATAIGNVLEMFDFFVFVFLSSVIANLFFPSSLHKLSLIFTYLTITISYLLRPVGGIILGNLGDKYGRKSVFTISILCTAIPSLVIGLLPTYQQIGYAATIALVIARIFQGFSSGAELPGAITFIAERYKGKNYYFYCAWIPFGANLSIAAGSLLIHEMTNSMSHKFLYTYGWRIPFLVGGLLAVVGFYIRRYIAETEQFKTLQLQKKVQHIPVFYLFKQHKTAIILGTFLALIISLITSIFHLFLPNLLVEYLQLQPQDASTVSAIGAFTLAVFIILVAALSYQLEPIRLTKIGLSGLIITFSLILTKYLTIQSLHSLYVVVIIVSILIAGINGIYSGLLVDLFPTEVRYSGVAVCYTLAALLGGGLTPVWTSTLLHLTGNYEYIIWVCIIVSLACLVNMYFLERYLAKNIYDMGIPAEV